MIDALAITIGSVLAGAVVGVLTGRKHLWFGSLRTFAVAAVVAVVVVQMLPEAVEPLGGWGLLVFAAAAAAPGLLAPLVRRFARARDVSRHGIGAELTFVGFLLHQVAEGLAVGTYATDGHAHHGHGTLYWAVAAHTLPLTALLVWEALAHRGRWAALVRTAALVGATFVGFLLADAASHQLHDEVHPFLTAAVSGFILHVIFHDHGPAPRRTATSSTLDVLAAGVGVLVPILAAREAGHSHGGEVRDAVMAAFAELLIETAPMLLLGLVLGAALQMFGSRIPARYFTSGSDLRQAARGVLVGAPLPLCACGVLPIAESLRRRGAGPALVMAFLIATPELGPETFALTVRFLGWPFAFVRLAAAIGLALLAAWIFAKAVRRVRPSLPVEDPGGSMIMAGATPRRRPLALAYGYFDELVLHTAPWTLVGLLAAAYVQAVLPADALARLADVGFDVPVVALVAMPAYVCAASATPLAAVLMLKGVSPGAVLVGLMLGPATNVATIGVLRRAYGLRAIAVGVVAVLGISMAIGYGVNAAAVPVELPEQLEDAHGHGWGAVV